MLSFSTSHSADYAGIIAGMITREQKSEYDRSRYQRLREETIARAKAAYEADPEKGKAKSRARYAAKREEILVQQKAYRLAQIEADPEYARREREAGAARWAANPERYRALHNAAAKERRLKDPEKHRAFLRARYWADPERAREKGVEYAARRRGRKIAAGGDFTAEDVRSMLVKQKGKCLICLARFGKKTPHVDHYVPLARGGTNDPSNLRLLCRKCNMAKHALDPIDFGRQNGLLCW